MLQQVESSDGNAACVALSVLPLPTLLSILHCGCVLRGTCQLSSSWHKCSLYGRAHTCGPVVVQCMCVEMSPFSPPLSLMSAYRYMMWSSRAVCDAFGTCAAFSTVWLSCDEVRAAYRRQGWAFTPGEQIEQCFRESMQRRLRGEVKEGCNIHGSLSVNRVAGNFQLSPGRTMTLFHPHLSNMASPEARPELNPSHTIHSLAFGAPYPGMSNPLDGVSQKIEPGERFSLSLTPAFQGNEPFIGHGSKRSIRFFSPSLSLSLLPCLSPLFTTTTTTTISVLLQANFSSSSTLSRWSQPPTV